jgi:hypothetical protein
MLGVTKHGGNDMDRFKILVETKLRISLTEWKILMLQILPTSKKGWAPHLKHDQQYAHY